MGILSYGYKASKTPVGKKVVETVKNIFKGGKQKITGTEVINKVTPNVPKTKLEKATTGLNLATQKSKAARAKLDQTIFESKNKAFRGDDFTFSYSKKKTPKVSEQKAKGGRVGYKRGTGLMKKKSDIQKIKETFSPKKSAAKKSTKFGMLSVKAGIDKNPNATYADKIAGAKMKSKKRFV